MATPMSFERSDLVMNRTADEGGIALTIACNAGSISISLWRLSEAELCQIEVV